MRKPCLVRGCPNYADTGSYCTEHRDRAALGLTGQRANTGDWQRTRAKAIARAKGRCQLRLTAACELTANRVHHRDLNPANNDPSNLAACCQPCHQIAHQLARSAAAARIGAR